MSELEYEPVENPRGGSDVMQVKLDGKVVGVIRLVIGGFTYIPKGQKMGDEVFRTVREVQHSLEGE